MSDTREKLEQMGFRILDAVRTELLLSMRFMAPALNSLGFKMDLATSSAGTDAAYIRFNPGFLLQVYVERPRRMNRMYMHMLIHCLFRHMFYMFQGLIQVLILNRGMLGTVRFL